MTEQSWSHIDKSEWPRGAWDSEPDKMQFTDEKTGMPCLIVRGPCGQICGYVGTTEGHPYFGKDHNQIEDDVEVHGGLTFADFCQEQAHEGEGICHIPGPGEPTGDLAPMTVRYLTGLSFSRDTYKTVGYVRKQCALLASQLAEVAN